VHRPVLFAIRPDGRKSSNAGDTSELWPDYPAGERDGYEPAANGPALQTGA
jgi:hypothetical protein